MTRPNEFIDDESLEAEPLSAGRERENGWEILPSAHTVTFSAATGRSRKRKRALGDDLDPLEGDWWDQLEEFARSTRSSGGFFSDEPLRLGPSRDYDDYNEECDYNENCEPVLVQQLAIRSDRVLGHERDLQWEREERPGRRNR